MWRATALALLVAAPVLAHEWFDPWCCSGEDCRPFAEGESYILRTNGDALVYYNNSWHTIPRIMTLQNGTEVTRVMPSRTTTPYLCAPSNEPEPRCVYYAIGF